MHAFGEAGPGTFIHVEPRQSLTAANADEWVRNAPGTEGLLALAILKTHGGRGPRPTAGSRTRSTGIDVTKVAEESGVPRRHDPALAAVFGRRPRPDWPSGAASPSPAPTPPPRWWPSTSSTPRSGPRGGRCMFGSDSAYAQGHALRRGGGPGGRHGQGRGGGPAPRPARQPGVHAARRAQVRGGGGARSAWSVSFAEPARRDDGAGARDPSRDPLAGVLGRLLAPRRRDRAHAADDVARSAMRCRSAMPCSASAGRCWVARRARDRSRGRPSSSI